MYLLGHHGNNLYPSSLRLFTDRDLLLRHIEEDRKSAISKYKDGAHSDHVKRITKDLPTYINSISYRIYEIDANKNEDPKNITRRQLAKIAKTWKNGSSEGE